MGEGVMTVDLSLSQDKHPESLPSGRLHRISRLMALAIKYEGLIRDQCCGTIPT